MIRRAVATLMIVGGVSFALANPASAAAPASFTQLADSCGNTVAAFLGLNPWDACLSHASNGAPQLKSLSDVWLVVLPLLADAIKIAGYTAAGFIFWGGIKYIKSQGDPSQINEARQVIYNALFGLVLALISVAIVNFIAGAIH